MLRQKAQDKQESLRLKIDRAGNEGVVAAGRHAAGREIIPSESLPTGDVQNALSFAPVDEQDLKPDEAERIEGFRQSPQNRGTAEQGARIVLPLDRRAGSLPNESKQADSALLFVRSFEKLTGKRVVFCDTDGPPRLAAASATRENSAR